MSIRPREELAGPRQRAAELRDTASASFAENGRIASSSGRMSVENTSARPSADGATIRGSGRTKRTPRRSSCMSATIAGRSGPIVCASVAAL